MCFVITIMMIANTHTHTHNSANKLYFHVKAERTWYIHTHIHRYQEWNHRREKHRYVSISARIIVNTADGYGTKTNRIGIGEYIPSAPASTLRVTDSTPPLSEVHFRSNTTGDSFHNKFRMLLGAITVYA